MHFLSTTFPDRAPNPRKQRSYTSATPGATLPKKNTGFHARECFHPRIHAVYTSQLLDDDDDDDDDDDKDDDDDDDDDDDKDDDDDDDDHDHDHDHDDDGDGDDDDDDDDDKDDDDDDDDDDKDDDDDDDDDDDKDDDDDDDDYDGDDDVDMMMSLTWWCCWHDDVVDMMVWMLKEAIVRNSEVVLTKLPLMIFLYI